MEKRMTTKVKKLKALLGFHGTSDTDLTQQLVNVYKGLKGNSNFPSTPVDLETFKSGIDMFTVLVTDAADGGKKAIAAKNKQREVLIKQVTLLGHYVEAASNVDPAIFTTSGFLAAPTERVAPQPLPLASIEWIDRGPVAGSVAVKVKGLPKAINYDLQYAVVATPGTMPTSWTTFTLPGSKKVTGFQSDPRRELRISGSCIGPFGSHQLERPNDVHLRLN